MSRYRHPLAVRRPPGYDFVIPCRTGSSSRDTAGEAGALLGGPSGCATEGSTARSRSASLPFGCGRFRRPIRRFALAAGIARVRPHAARMRPSGCSVSSSHAARISLRSDSCASSASSRSRSVIARGPSRGSISYSSKGFFRWLQTLPFSRSARPRPAFSSPRRASSMPETAADVALLLFAHVPQAHLHDARDVRQPFGDVVHDGGVRMLPRGPLPRSGFVRWRLCEFSGRVTKSLTNERVCSFCLSYPPI
jgi:hypothetical protein